MEKHFLFFTPLGMLNEKKKKKTTFRIYMKNYVGKRLVGERKSFGKSQKSIYVERKGMKRDKLVMSFLWCAVYLCKSIEYVT